MFVVHEQEGTAFVYPCIDFKTCTDNVKAMVIQNRRLSRLFHNGLI